VREKGGEVARTPKKKKDKPVYEVTPTGRLTITDFAERVGARPGDRFVLQKPRGSSPAWLVAPHRDED
jgi:hydrogenase maturation factor